MADHELFVDTSGWACYYDQRQRWHEDAKQTCWAAIAEGRLLVTTNYILAELVAVMTSPLRIPRARLVSWVDRLRESPHVLSLHVDAELDAAAWQMLKDRQDKEWSLVDCASFLVMEQRGMTQALTTDRHFEQAGFVRLLKP